MRYLQSARRTSFRRPFRAEPCCRHGFRPPHAPPRQKPNLTPCTCSQVNVQCSSTSCEGLGPMMARTILVAILGPTLLLMICGALGRIWINGPLLDEYWRDGLAVFGGLGTIATLAGLAAAFWQVTRARSAAEAATEAANQARARMVRMSALVDLTRLRSQSNEVVALLRVQKTENAALRLSDLHESVIQFRSSPQGRDRMSAKKWTEMLTNIRQLEEALVGMARQDGDPHNEFLGAMRDIHGRLVELATSAADIGDE